MDRTRQTDKKKQTSQEQDRDPITIIGPIFVILIFVGLPLVFAFGKRSEAKYEAQFRAELPREISWTSGRDLSIEAEDWQYVELGPAHETADNVMAAGRKLTLTRRVGRDERWVSRYESLVLPWAIKELVITQGGVEQQRHSLAFGIEWGSAINLLREPKTTTEGGHS